jgi:hypothetical protein
MQIKPNLVQTTCLRPSDDKLDEFMPLWDARNAVIAQKDAAIEASFAAAARQDMPALLLREEALSAEMLPLQFKAWERIDPNLVTNAGRNDILDKYWRSAGYTQTVVMGLAGAGTKAAGDTQASHAGWSEQGGTNAPAYTGNRKAVTMGAASSQASVSPQQSFAITSTGTVAGLFMNNGGSATKDDTTGTLVSAVDFTGGTEAVNNLDTLLVTYTFNG